MAKMPALNSIRTRKNVLTKYLTTQDQKDPRSLNARLLVVDTGNLAFMLSHSIFNRGTRGILKQHQAVVAELLFDRMIGYVLSFAAKHRRDAVVFVFDSKNVWRKSIYPEYKANRDHGKDEFYDQTISALRMLETYTKKHTACMSLQVQRCEADDIIGFLAQNTENEMVILSSDRDFVQLLVPGRVRVYSPQTKAWLESEDPAFDLFVKCVRGDANDNIRAAYPRVRKTKLQKAWNDKYEMLNLVETILPSGEKVQPLLERNRDLIDLSRLPGDIRDSIRDSIESYVPGPFSKPLYKTFVQESLTEKDPEYDVEDLNLSGERGMMSHPLLFSTPTREVIKFSSF